MDYSKVDLWLRRQEAERAERAEQHRLELEQLRTLWSSPVKTPEEMAKWRRFYMRCMIVTGSLAAACLVASPIALLLGNQAAAGGLLMLTFIFFVFCGQFGGDVDRNSPAEKSS
jgi:hypothetical protein